VLADYVYRSAHTAVMRQRRRWFEHIDEAFVALWWVPAGYRPDVAEAEQRLRHLHERGREPFPAPGSVQAAQVREDDLCPV